MRIGRTVSYGWVDDLIVKNGKVSAVIVQLDVRYGDYNPDAPPYGYDYGFDPGLGYYEIPYGGADEIAVLEPVDYEILDNEVSIN
jgi:hypothetical protein